MKRILFIVLLFLISSYSFGQKIHFTDSTNVWTMFSCLEDASIDTRINSEAYGATEIIDSQKYRNIALSYVREDTVANIVYIMRYDNEIGMLDSVEEILYDYNWVINDTVKSHGLDHEGTSAWVTAIDSTMISGIWYKVWHFSGIDSVFSLNPFSYNVIEGIGCTNGFNYPVQPYYAFEFSQQLICFNNDIIHAPLSNPVSSWGLLGDKYFDNSSSCTLGTIDVSIKNTHAFVVPNPINETGRIILPDTIASGTLVIFNVVGQIVVTTTFKNKEILPIGNEIRSSGIYYYRVTDDNGKVYSEKFAAQ